MHLLSIASSFPKSRFSQSDCLAALQQSEFWMRLSGRSLRILEKVLTGNNGIEYRNFAVDSLEQAWRRDAQQLNEAYESEAPVLGGRAVSKALERAELKPSEVDVLLVSTCTGFLCPGVSNHIAERLGFRSDAVLQDLTGHGCGAAIPLVQVAAAYAKLYPRARIVTAQVEVCSAAFHLDDDVGVLISACLFGDGASAQVWSSAGGDLEVGRFESVHRPEHREDLRFVNHEGRLKNRLRKTVPSVVAESVERLVSKQKLQEKAQPVLHGGGRDVLDALEPVFPGHALDASRETLRRHGNLSSPSVFVALEALLADRDSVADEFWLCGFGAGFSAHSVGLTHVS
ncbi:type III polyketide synthase [Coraliomargarita akajimensis]|uniref:Chalcone and stilbene synthase domain protein n=1 Tax=Coraliomargarita akajimensis (strain DSM 45221 / IAM 15411 / JCM 23193 / KCTC 12865 / 04OKA010-24) TaxID=583355 RepID=D5ER32_CORAD|nr:chalcone and stilbene synthase [Coraliomargarita akajimensis]ADE54025.1 chalcone and stilbene synthase domain protein [Coraliomargarita akajimensis DSM 45221]